MQLALEAIRKVFFHQKLQLLKLLTCL